MKLGVHPCKALAMIFRQYTPEIEEVDKIVVDGIKCGAGLQLSHWPGNTTHCVSLRRRHELR
jgi:hypothetical protein